MTSFSNENEKLDVNFLVPRCGGEFSFVPYVPDLGMFEQLVSNWYENVITNLPNVTTLVCDKDSWMWYAKSVLFYYSHLSLNDEYKLAGITTDSPGKLRAQFGESPVVQWLIDVCREICRPMIHSGAIFIPIIPVHAECATSGPLPNLGVCSSDTAFVNRTLYGVLEITSVRDLVGEKLLIAPLSVADGEYTFQHSTTSSWRKEAFDLLRHFVNGCSIGASNLKTKPKAVRAKSFARDVVKVYGFNPVLKVSAPTLDPKFVDDTEKWKFLTSVMKMEPFTFDDKSVSLWLYYEDKRTTEYNAWIARAAKRTSALPPEMERKEMLDKVYDAVLRFPSENMRSKTPTKDPQKTTKTVPLGAAERRRQQRKRRKEKKAEDAKSKNSDEADGEDKEE